MKTYLKRNTKLIQIILGFVLIISFLICIFYPRHAQRVNPYGWLSTTPQCDSLLRTIDSLWTEGNRDISTPLQLLQKVSAKTQEDFLPLAYWQARTASPAEEKSRLRKLIARAKKEGDGYTLLRARVALEGPADEFTARGCSILDVRATEFEKYDDWVNAASAHMDLGSGLTYMGFPQGGLSHLLRADSLLTLAGHERGLLGNRINKSWARAAAKDSAGAARELRELLTLPAFQTDTIGLKIALGNLYVYAQDTSALSRAWHLATTDPDPDPEEIMLLASFMAEEKAKQGNIEQARKLADTATANYSEDFNPSFLKDYHRAMQTIYRKADNQERLILHVQKEKEISAKLCDTEESIRAVRTDYERILSSQREKAQKEARRSSILFWLYLGLALLLLTSGIIILLLMRKKMRIMKSTNLEQESRLAHAQQQTLAMNLLLAEDRNSGTPSPERQTDFMATFGERNPHFEKNFRTQYPTATESDLRLACLIATGIDTKQTARVLGIRPESVKQARWRLRRHMNLPPGSSLEKALSTLNTQ